MKVTTFRPYWQLISPMMAVIFLYSGMLWSEERVIPQPEIQLANSIASHYKNLRMGDEVLQLESNGETYWALYQQNRTARPQGGVLLIHDQAQSMDWPIMLQEIRTYLPDTGWDTLSIAMPEAADTRVPARIMPPVPDVFNYNLSFKEFAHSRIQEGINELIRRDALNIVLVGYGTGSHWAANYMAEQMTDTDNAGNALILIDMREPSNDPALNIETDLASLSIPILDVHFSESRFEMQQARLRRGAVLRTGYEHFTQIKEVKLNSEFANGPGRVTRRVWGWLKNNAAGEEAETDATP